MAIQVAKKNIPAALAKLDQYIEKASKLEVSAINSFTADSEKLFQIIGQEAGDFVKRRQEIDMNVKQLYKKQNELWDEYVKSLGETKFCSWIPDFYVILNSLIFKFIGEADRYFHLYEATKNYIANEKAANESTKDRISQLEELNRTNEKRIEDIQTRVVENVTVKIPRRWVLWQSKQTTFCEMVRI